MKAEALFREKRIVFNRRTEEVAFAEIKIWGLPKTAHYPLGKKFSLFLISDGKVVIGIDNHKPKGPHLHMGNQEVPFEYSNDTKLLSDFWNLVRKAGYEP